MQRALGGCQNDWCDMWTLYLLMTLMTLNNAEEDQTYWAYVPDPPILHPAVWDGSEIPVYVNDTHALGLPSDGHIKQHLKSFVNQALPTVRWLIYKMGLEIGPLLLSLLMYLLVFLPHIHF
ncbi:hypothetical protein mRhiFer1_007905 [Rhinolophus ferrumequinum]|uniref:Uncharacterized protein n=1 Tax=Rhinolophus ferrumequinum TaxID=59479 RepID=A0A7J8AVT4_RHIFE|nr:hypothetical protein mRhiFer1_007905 [Rhinolophus ferrumequinum]